MTITDAELSTSPKTNQARNISNDLIRNGLLNSLSCNDRECINRDCVEYRVTSAYAINTAMNYTGDMRSRNEVMCKAWSSLPDLYQINRAIGFRNCVCSNCKTAAHVVANQINYMMYGTTDLDSTQYYMDLLHPRYPFTASTLELSFAEACEKVGTAYSNAVTDLFYISRFLIAEALNGDYTSLLTGEMLPDPAPLIKMLDNEDNKKLTIDHREFVRMASGIQECMSLASERITVLAILLKQLGVDYRVSTYVAQSLMTRNGAVQGRDMYLQSIGEDLLCKLTDNNPSLRRMPSIPAYIVTNAVNSIQTIVQETWQSALAELDERADEIELCSQYDSAIERMVSSCFTPSLATPDREREIEGYARIAYSGTVSILIRATVRSGEDQQVALQEAADDIEESDVYYQIRENVNNSEYEIDEVEEI